MKTPQATTVLSAAAIVAMNVGGASLAAASDCAPDWVKQAFIMGNETPCLYEDIMIKPTVAATPRYRLRPKGSSTPRTTRVARRGSAKRSRLVTHLAAAKHKSPHWGYTSDNGPAKWSALNGKFRLCGTGRQQSPIDITAAADGEVATVAFDYRRGPATIANNGHTVQVSVARGNRLRIGDRVYRLIQFHFHTPSENTIGGLHYPMETHLVHSDGNGRLAVIALMVRAGRKGVLDRLPQPSRAGEKANVGTIDPSDLLPVSTDHYVFKGSLTTPPCSEGVDWFVMKQPIEADHATIAGFYAILGANNRPTSPLNGRAVKLAR